MRSRWAHEVGQRHRRPVGVDKPGAKIARLGVIGVGVIVAVVGDKRRCETKHAIGDKHASSNLGSANGGIKPIHGNNIGSPDIGHLQGVGRQGVGGSHPNHVSNPHAYPLISQAVVGRRRRGGDNHIAIRADDFADIMHVTAGGKSDTV